ncbi:MAG: 2-dehydropantoate 2-reductase [Deltaproteobacteria bacterium]|nr:2-dehydropantoate 2-reductase [Deltaproteobacteria bacterium]
MAGPVAFTFGIAGAGAIGSMIAAHLAKAGAPVLAYDVRKELLEAIAARGIRVTGASPVEARITGTSATLAGLSEAGANVLLVSLKAPTFRRELCRVLSGVRGNTDVVVVQNGIDNEDMLKEGVPAERIFRMVVNFAGNYVSDGVVNMTFHNPPSYMGALAPGGEARARALASALSAAGLATEFTLGIKAKEWAKTVLNAAMSPVCGVTGQTMKQAFDLPETHAVTEALMREGIAVAEALGYGMGEGFFEHGMAYLSRAGNHKPSLLVDIEAGVETEIDFLNGAIVRRAAEAGVPVPYNAALTALVKGKEQAGR